eukprot:scpid28581/ scgid25496/ 2-methoxy-6-polyprenyl-1,4-benzoquinol methylase, mitochondrial; Ubiquinone biosynthesis methyltransferase COQ5
MGKVHHVFSNVAEKYDLMNDVMSIGVHRLWKDRFANLLRPSLRSVHLDVAGGTGDIAFRIMNKLVPGSDNQVIVCDINESMLRVGQQRATEQGIQDDRLQWVQGNAEKLPMPDSSVDTYTIAFGIRNVTYIDKALEEAHRVLKPGGRFLCLEFSQVDNPILAEIYDFHSFKVIPILGEIFARDRDSYQYLVESIRRFPSREQFCDMMRDAGFQQVSVDTVQCGIAAIHSGFKFADGK